MCVGHCELLAEVTASPALIHCKDEAEVDFWWTSIDLQTLELLLLPRLWIQMMRTGWHCG